MACAAPPCAAPPPKPQLYLGPPGSGAPLHFHKDAYNALAFGEKRWWLLPPHAARYSAEPVSAWLARGGAGDGGAGADAAARAPAQCTQRAGDVIFVPRGWAHAVLNTRTSVGVASEFAAATHEA